MVQAKNGSQDSCETFYFAGANTYYLVCALAMSHPAAMPCFLPHSKLHMLVEAVFTSCFTAFVCSARWMQFIHATSGCCSIELPIVIRFVCR